jgi:lipid A 4'-phosphatase
MVLVFLLSAVILGPGLLVNMGLKDNWGRPRPRQVMEFGGEKHYEPPLSPGLRCDDCHSFVSGHASIGFCFFGLALLSRSRKWLWLPAIAGTAIGVTRIAQGGHFLSDVLFSGWVVWYSTVFLHGLFSRHGMIPQGGTRHLDRQSPSRT